MRQHQRVLQRGEHLPQRRIHSGVSQRQVGLSAQRGCHHIIHEPNLQHLPRALDRHTSHQREPSHQSFWLHPESSSLQLQRGYREEVCSREIQLHSELNLGLHPLMGSQNGNDLVSSQNLPALQSLQEFHGRLYEPYVLLCERAILHDDVQDRLQQEIENQW
ncbi:unannotated protein [freshwater metagenome]|uniref:Unannotated protein n=1 Tax=freshwater metagenome TaxID=449393 RepID=A0A6J6HSX3_9ZZZZ